MDKFIFSYPTKVFLEKAVRSRLLKKNMAGWARLLCWLMAAAP